MKTNKNKFTAILIVTLTNLLLCSSIFAQSPSKMSYQAVIRNNSNVLVTNTQVGVKIQIWDETNDLPIYTETQTPTSNDNGLISIEIGGEIGFDTISWMYGDYFIQTDIDPDPAGGLTDYSITGISQLLSVPYALHSRTAESLTSTIPETDPIFTGSQAANITSDDITNLANLSGENTGDQDGSETIITAGTNLSVTGTGTSVDPYQINSTGGALAFAQFYAIMPWDNIATVAVGAAVDFPQDGPSSGTIVRLNASQFMLSDIGTYSVSWQVSVDEPGQLVLVLNGIQIPYTVVGRATGTTQITGNCLITTTTPNSILSLRNPVGNSTALTITPIAGGTNSVSATLVIMRIQ
jgi:hypothetical protein